MKKVFILLLNTLLLYANIEIYSFKSDFLQIIKDENKNIKYFGKIYFKKPLMILWIYEKPIKKKIFIVNNEVVIIEPEIEQITISKNRDIKNIIKILNNSKKISKNLYEAIYNDQKFLIYLEDNRLKKIKYKDRFEKDVEIIFLNPEQNIDIPNSIFKYKIDPEFDLIYQ